MEGIGSVTSQEAVDGLDRSELESRQAPLRPSGWNVRCVHQTREHWSSGEPPSDPSSKICLEKGCVQQIWLELVDRVHHVTDARTTAREGTIRREHPYLRHREAHRWHLARRKRGHRMRELVTLEGGQELTERGFCPARPQTVDHMQDTHDGLATFYEQACFWCHSTCALSPSGNSVVGRQPKSSQARRKARAVSWSARWGSSQR